MNPRGAQPARDRLRGPPRPASRATPWGGWSGAPPFTPTPGFVYRRAMNGYQARELTTALADWWREQTGEEVGEGRQGRAVRAALYLVAEFLARYPKMELADLVLTENQDQQWTEKQIRSDEERAGLCVLSSHTKKKRVVWVHPRTGWFSERHG